MKRLNLKVASRQEIGRHPARRLRNQGFIPATVYGKSGTSVLQVEDKVFRTMMREAAGSASLIEISDGKDMQRLSILQEIQRDPRTDEFLHIDFLEVSDDKPITIDLAVHLIGESIGVKSGSGLLELHIHTLNVRCLPKDLPDFVEIDISALDIGEAIHIRELTAIPGVTFAGNDDVIVVSCAKTRSSTSAAAAKAVQEKTEDAS